MSARSNKIRAEIAKVIIGQVDVIDQVMMVIIAGGHGLLVGMPGMAKTTLCATIAKVLDMEFKRVQFTPDLMPTDITGTEILEHDPVTDQKNFRFIKGPIFTNMLLADEINRTPPKTQASLLEAMQEKCVTVGNQTYKLDAPFFVLATQNPIEQEGTYPLPEAQQDRFMFNLWVDYPLEDEEETVVKATTVAQRETPNKVISKEELLQLQEVVRKIPVSDHVIKYAVRLVRATRPHDEKSPDFIKKYVSNGAGPRAGQFLVLAAKARAVLEGRIHVSCNDVVKAAVPVLRHRIIANFAADSEGISTTALVERLLKTVTQPDDSDYQSR
ncbi:MAG: MoxR family ATPase [Kiritimatiellae bacterium]|nr:MoxR family ATPase [Kiritimatiellia bacterium]